MDNAKKQSIAIDAIHKISHDADMMVFMLVDEDLELMDGYETLTQDEKNDIWERMHEAVLDFYHERLTQVVQDVIDERDA
jgi:hypothetical protein